MKLFTVITHNGFSDTQAYLGDSIIQVIENNIFAVAQRAGLGNAAGFRLDDAKIVPAQSGKGGHFGAHRHRFKIGPQKRAWCTKNSAC